MRCHFEDRDLVNLRQANEMIKGQKMHKTRFLRQFGIQTSIWNEWVSGKKHGVDDRMFRKIKNIFSEFGI